jgi:hypothetical protein
MMIEKYIPGGEKVPLPSGNFTGNITHPPMFCITEKPENP